MSWFRNVGEAAKDLRERDKVWMGSGDGSREVYLSESAHTGTWIASPCFQWRFLGDIRFDTLEEMIGAASRWIYQGIPMRRDG